MVSIARLAARVACADCTKMRGNRLQVLTGQIEKTRINWYVSDYSFACNEMEGSQRRFYLEDSS